MGLDDAEPPCLVQGEGKDLSLAWFFRPDYAKQGPEISPEALFEQLVLTSELGQV